MRRIRSILLMLACGGALLQTTAGCEETVGPLIANLATSVILEILLGGLAT